jgi:AsmA protein
MLHREINIPNPGMRGSLHIGENSYTPAVGASCRYRAQSRIMKLTSSLLRKPIWPRPPWLQATLRALLLIFFVIVLMSALFRVAAPLLIQTTMVRSGMERAIAQWTGHDVTIEGASRIMFWPQPRIELERITVSKPEPDGVRILSRTAKLSAGFSLYQAILGKAEFNDFRLVGPEIYVRRDPTGRLDWVNDGQLSAATRDIAASDGKRPLDATLDVAVGDIAIENGRIEVQDVASGETWTATAIGGTVDWPRVSAPVTAQLDARIADQELQVRLSSRQPLLMLAGKPAPIDVGIASAILTGSFSGSADISTGGSITGSLELSVPDVAALASWVNFDGEELASVKQLSLSAQVETVEDAIRLDQMQALINGSAGSGSVEISSTPSGMGTLSGTLAFERLDLVALARSVAAITKHTNSRQPLTFRNLDLRISGQETVAGPLALSQTALGIMTRSGEARIDILDGQVEGGQVTGHLIGDGGIFSSGGTGRLVLSDADLTALWQRLGIRGPLPVGRGSIDLDMSFPGSPFSQGLSSLSGVLHITGGQGVLPDIEPETILQRVGSGAYSPLRNPGGEDFEYQRLDITAQLAGGVVWLETATVEGTDMTVKASGVVSSGDGGVALSVVVTDATSRGSSSRIFVGGTWADPVALEVR